ncbi:hypothetical protein GCM10010124_29040 [Pilimelia terevasa]|uniref:Secreted protein n=1 Tax=Pilimelia terevasa TaxID=53372 RepID=A0A8J3BSM6_9ACTN|nr:hypothetical protein [Pilimelia terevasa]GGK34569.1 hypothetical protein GCM10010124_29040 [Pilimelia terevasa]
MRATLIMLMAAASVATAATPAHAIPSAPDLLSDAPKTVHVDPATGRILAVRSGASDRVSNRPICHDGDACYYAGRAPLANQGFYGAPGKYPGNWPVRSGYYTGQYTATFCWTKACGPKTGPRTEVWYGDGTQTVTGTSVTIH